MAVLLTPPYLQFFDDDGAPLAGGKVYSYTATGTFTTPKATFTTAAGDVEQTNPIELDASGRPTLGNGSIWLSGTYDFKVTDALDNIIETTFGVTSFTTLPPESDAYFQSFSGTGAQTAFTCSEDLGSDEKAIYVWVDAGAGKGYDIINPSAYTISGTALTFNAAPASGTNNIYVSAPSLLVGAASSSAADASSSAADAAASAAAALVSEIAAAASAAKLTGTSTTSLAITVASKTFTTQASKFFDVGNFLLITSDAATTNYMHGQVTAYSGTSLTVNVTNIGGSGTYADWTIRLSGTRGVKGDTGTVNDLSGVPSGTPTLTDGFIFEDVSDGNLTKICAYTELLKLVYPVGSYYFNETDSTNPATLFGFGTWSAVTDKFIMGASGTYPAGTTGGSTTHTLTISEVPNLQVPMGTNVVSNGSTGPNYGPSGQGTNTTGTLSTNNGGGGSHSILNPYISSYIWKRTA